VPERRERADFIAAIKAKQAAGKKVLISIGGQNGQVQLTTTGGPRHVRQLGLAIIDKYGLDGLDIDFEGHSLSLNAGDTDFKNPTTPVIVNLISAAEDPEGQVRRRLRPDDGAGDVLRPARLPVLRPASGAARTRAPAPTSRSSTPCATT
jgi:hypothetical protein